jgi:hypothetical protein
MLFPFVAGSQGASKIVHARAALVFFLFSVTLFRCFFGGGWFTSDEAGAGFVIVGEGWSGEGIIFRVWPSCCLWGVGGVDGRRLSMDACGERVPVAAAAP